MARRSTLYTPLVDEKYYSYAPPIPYVNASADRVTFESPYYPQYPFPIWKDGQPRPNPKSKTVIKMWGGEDDSDWFINVINPTDEMRALVRDGIYYMGEYAVATDSGNVQLLQLGDIPSKRKAAAIFAALKSSTSAQLNPRKARHNGQKWLRMPESGGGYYPEIFPYGQGGRIPDGPQFIGIPRMNPRTGRRNPRITEETAFRSLTDKELVEQYLFLKDEIAKAQRWVSRDPDMHLLLDQRMAQLEAVESILAHRRAAGKDVDAKLKKSAKTRAATKKKQSKQPGWSHASMNPLHTPHRISVSRFPGACALCKEAMIPGTKIAQRRDGKWLHYTCAE